MAWYGGDFVTKQPTVIAWKFVGQGRRPEVAAIGASDRSSLLLREEAEMIEAFRVAYNAADMVTGHFIRGFDLPVLNGAVMRLGLDILEDKLAEDTKLDLIRGQGISKSMENLSAMFEAAHPKYGMNTDKWFRANALLPDGILLAKTRCSKDVTEHLELREILLDRGLLTGPKIWRSGATKEADYVP